MNALVTVGECDDDYCTGCEPGYGLDQAQLEGPDLPPMYGPEPYSFAWALNENFKAMYGASLIDLIPSLPRVLPG